MTMEYVYIFVMYALLPEFSISIQSRLVHCAPDLAAASTAPMVILLSSLHALKQVINIQASFFQCTYSGNLLGIQCSTYPPHDEYKCCNPRVEAEGK